MAQSKTSTVLDKTRPNAWGGGGGGDHDGSVVNGWEENFSLSQPILCLLFGGTLLASKSLLTIPS